LRILGESSENAMHDVEKFLFDKVPNGVLLDWPIATIGRKKYFHIQEANKAIFNYHKHQ
jgi:hypothetical protein